MTEIEALQQEIERLKEMLHRSVTDNWRRVFTDEDTAHMADGDADWVAWHVAEAFKCVNSDMWEDAFGWMEKAFRLYVVYSTQRMKRLDEERNA